MILLYLAFAYVAGAMSLLLVDGKSHWQYKVLMGVGKRALSDALGEAIVALTNSSQQALISDLGREDVRRARRVLRGMRERLNK